MDQRAGSRAGPGGWVWSIPCCRCVATTWCRLGGRRPASSAAAGRWRIPLTRLSAWAGSVDGAFLQGTLMAALDRFFAGREHLAIEFADLMDNPRREVERLMEYLSITAEAEKIEAAVRFIEPGKQVQGRGRTGIEDRSGKGAEAGDGMGDDTQDHQGPRQIGHIDSNGQSLPLTLTVSLGRGTHCDRSGSFIRRRTASRAAQGLPLPEREGWGEGEVGGQLDRCG